jgi:hypothetical protein
MRQEFLGEYEELKKDGDFHNQWTLDVSAEQTFESPFVALFVQGYDYRGGAHGLPILDVLYFDSQSKQPLKQEELLVPGAYESLSKLSRKGLESQGFASDDDWMLAGTEPSPENFQIVVPTKDGLVIHFSSYQVAPYSAGVPSVTIPWAEAAELFREAYRPVRG